MVVLRVAVYTWVPCPVPERHSSYSDSGWLHGVYYRHSVVLVDMDNKAVLNCFGKVWRINKLSRFIKILVLVDNMQLSGAKIHKLEFFYGLYSCCEHWLQNDRFSQQNLMYFFLIYEQAFEKKHY